MTSGFLVYGTDDWTNPPAGFYFIDYVGGNDANAGTNINLPWKHCPGDNSATGTAAAHTPAAGDTFIFKGGVTYTGVNPGGTTTMITPATSGTAALPITYRGNTPNGNWGVGKALFDLNASYYRCFACSNKNWIVINNIDFSNAKNTSSSSGGNGGQYYITRGGTDQLVTYSGTGNVANGGVIRNDQGSHWVVTNCIFHEPENWADLSPIGSSTGVTVTGAADNGSGAIRIAYSGNNNFVRTGDSVTISQVNPSYINGTYTATSIDGTHVDLQGSTFGAAYVSGGLMIDSSCPSSTPCQQYQVWMNGSTGTDFQITNNEFYAFAYTGIYLFSEDTATISGNNFGGIGRGAKTGFFDVAIRIAGGSAKGNNSITVTQNTFHDGWQYEGDDPLGRSHAGDWIHIYSPNGRVQDGILLERNYLYNNKSFDYLQGSAFCLVENSIGTINIRNNIVVNPHASLGTFAVGPGTLTLSNLDNNTIIVYPTNLDANPSGMEPNAGFGNSNVRNNLFINYCPSGTACLYNNVGGTVASLLSTVNNNIFYCPNGASAWKWGATLYSLAAWQAFASKDASSVTTNPNLASVPATGATSSSGSYLLTVSSTNALDLGLTISLFANDYFGTARPQGSAWDIGYYEKPV